MYFKYFKLLQVHYCMRNLIVLNFLLFEGQKEINQHK